MILSGNMLLLILSVLLSSFQDGSTSRNHNQSFRIERSKDANQIFYDINITSENKLNQENPIKIYWVKHTNKGKIESLTWIQQKYAYGLKYLKKSETGAVFQFVSYSKRSFLITKDITGVYNVITTVKDQPVQVDRIFIQIDGGTFWFPKISRIELHAKDMETNQKVTEIIIP